MEMLLNVSIVQPLPPSTKIVSSSNSMKLTIEPPTHSDSQYYCQGHQMCMKVLQWIQLEESILCCPSHKEKPVPRLSRSFKKLGNYPPKTHWRHLPACEVIVIQRNQLWTHLQYINMIRWKGGQIHHVNLQIQKQNKCKAGPVRVRQ